MVYSLKGLLMLLLVLGVGYIVLAEASRNKGALKGVGYIIGTLIIACSLVVIALKVSPYARCKPLREKSLSGSSGPKQIVSGTGVMMPPKK